MKAVDEIEVNLKALVERESRRRQGAIAELKSSVRNGMPQSAGSGSRFAEFKSLFSALREDVNELANAPDDAMTKLENKGILLEMVYTGERVSILSGGVNRQSDYLENGDIILSIDAEKLLSWKGASFSFYGLGNNGGDPSENIGDVQGSSNIESPDTWKIYEAWYQQEYFDGRLSYLVGLYDLNSEFDVIENAGLFLNSSFGIGPDFSQSGENGPSIFPTTSIALRVKVQPSDRFYVQSAVLDGVSGDPQNPTGTSIKFGHGDGILLSTEVAYLTGAAEDSEEAYGKLALGTWFYTAKFDDMLQVDGNSIPIRRSGNRGIYALGERVMYRETNDSDQGIAVFARVGFANGNFNQFGSYFGAGLATTGLIPGLDGEQIGLAIAIAKNSREFKEAQSTAAIPVGSSEIALELTFRSQVFPHLVIQPDFQYIINPGTDPLLKNAFVVGTRFELSL